MKFVFPAWFLIPCAQVLAQGVPSLWFPLDGGNKWTYEHEYRDGSARNPHITRWQTVETLIGTLTIPEGTVLLRHVEVEGDAPGGWLQTVYGESNYLIRNDCLYFLNPQHSWSEQEQGLRPEYRAQILAGDIEPEFCFPLAVGRVFGKDSVPGWIPSRVVGMGAGHGLAPGSVSQNAFDVVVHLVSADETHLWFEKGVGITGEWDWHNGTYGDYRIRLLRFQPTSKRAANGAPPSLDSKPKILWTPAQGL